MKTLVIGELGSTPEGNLDTMKRLVDCAANCGANVAKNQWVSDAQAMCDRRHAPEYLDSYRLLQYPLEWHAELRDYAHGRGLQYACTAYIPGDPARLAPFVDYLKLSSFEADDGALFRQARRAAGVNRLIMSYGMGARLRNDPHCFHLACISAYPAPLSELNLGVLGYQGDQPEFDGFSDHSRDVRVGAWAVAAGARILETHFRLDDCGSANRDYAVAFTPAEFKEYIRNVRDCEQAMGDWVKRIQDCEREMERFKVRV